MMLAVALLIVAGFMWMIGSIDRDTARKIKQFKAERENNDLYK
jgi:hypothetical protein